MERKCRSRDEGFSDLVAEDCFVFLECNNLRGIVLKFGDKKVKRKKLERVGFRNVRMY